MKLIVADPPWAFSDSLKMSKVKRGADSNYDTMNINDIKSLDIKGFIKKEDAVLALWCPSSLLKEGIEVMEEWGFCLKQTQIWVKTKKNPLTSLVTSIKKQIKEYGLLSIINNLSMSFDLDNVLAFGMGRIFRQTHEVVLIGTKGKVGQYVMNKSQRSVHFFPATKHSVKPEKLQDMLEKIYPDSDKIELFARRDRFGWRCFGNECPSTIDEDIKDSIERLKIL